MRKRLGLGLLLCLLLAVAVERHLATPVPTAEPHSAPGRRLFLLIIDSLSLSDVEGVPALETLAAEGYAAEIEPCLERITVTCVGEMLTGRRTFSLLGLFRNQGGRGDDPGPNLLRQARADDRRVGMISAGDLGRYIADIDTDRRFKEPDPDAEMATVRELVTEHDLVLYHYIWHDIVAHRSAADSKRYADSLEALQTLVTQIQTDLPPDMDLMVSGDHGHTIDGRHVQGQDVPTWVAVRSPAVASGRADERLPITVVRDLAGQVTGLTPAQTGEAGPQRAPWAALAICVALAVAAGPLALAALAGGALMGLTLDLWLAWMHTPVHLPRVYDVLGVVPAAAAAAAWVRRRTLSSALAGLALACAVIVVALYPVPHHYGVLKNASNIMLTVVVGAAAMALVRPAPRRWLPALVGAVGVWAWLKLASFKVWNLAIARYRAAALLDGPVPAPLIIGALMAALHALLTPRLPPRIRAATALLAGVLASGVLPLPPLAYLPPMLLLCGVLMRRVAHRAAWVSLLTAACMPHLFDADRTFGIIALLLASGLVLWSLRPAVSEDSATEDSATEDSHRTRNVLRAVVALLTGYVGLAWSFGLTLSGIDFAFAMAWLPEGRWHERLWLPITLLTTMKVMTPVILTAELLRREGADIARQVGAIATTLGSLRVCLVMTLAITWVAARGADAAGLRLALMLQDGFFWALIALGLGLLLPRGGPPPKPEAA